MDAIQQRGLETAVRAWIRLRGDIWLVRSLPKDGNCTQSSQASGVLGPDREDFKGIVGLLDFT